MSVSDDDINRIYDRLDEIQKALDTRLRALEIWQAYQTGRLTALAVLFSALGAAVLWAGNLLAKHFRMLVVIAAVGIVLMLSGCVAARSPQQVSVATTRTHVERAAAYVDAAATSTVAAKRGVAKVSAATKEVCAAVEHIADEPVKEAVQAKLRAVQEGVSEANAELARVTVALESAKVEEVNTKLALQETQAKINSLEAYNVSLAKDRDAAVEHAGALKKSNETLAGRLNKLVLALSVAAGLLVWSISSKFAASLLPVPYNLLGPIGIGIVAGMAVGTWLRYVL